MLTPSTSPRNLLVIDDDAIMREILAAILGMEGYNVHLTSSGEEALTFLAHSSSNIDIILVDLHMPGVQGQDLAEQLNLLRAPATPLIGMSGSRPSTEEMHIYNAFLDKPFTVEQFAQALQAASQAEQTTAFTPTAPHPTTTADLDESIYNRLAAILPPAQLRELYRITIADVRSRVQTMRTALEHDDFDTCRREAHAIKGGCGMVGATAISALASRVESATTPPVDGSGPAFPEFDDACIRLQVILDVRLTSK